MLNGSPLAAGGTFTQADIDSSRISYQQKAVKPIASAGQLNLSGPPKISGANAVWAADDGTGDSEIFFYNGGTGSVTQVTNNGVNDTLPQISGSNVVWKSDTGTAAEIYLYNGSTGVTTRVTNNSIEDTNPQISDTFIAWQKQYTTESDVGYYRLSTGTSGTIDGSISYDDTQVKLSGTKVAFTRNDLTPADLDGIYFYNLDGGGTPIRVAAKNAAYSDSLVGIAGSTVVWERYYSASSQSDILYDSDPNVGGFNVISNNPDFNDYNTIVSDSSIAFIRNQVLSNNFDGIYLYEFGSGNTTRITTTLASSPTISGLSGSNIAWYDNSSGHYQVSLYSNGVTKPVAGGAVEEALFALSGANGVWIGGTLVNFNKVFFYDGTTPSDTFGFTVSDGSLSTSGTFNVTIS